MLVASRGLPSCPPALAVAPALTLEEMVEEMKLAAPHTFGTLNLSDSSFLDLE